MTSQTDDILAPRGDHAKGLAAIAVYGASGHTGRFVVAELRRRNLPVVAIGRSAEKLEQVEATETRIASLDDPAALDRALAGASVVINCAGPFLDTAQPVIEAALRGGVHYLDVTAEQQAARDTFANFNAAARSAGIKIVPAASFYGGLASLLARAAMQGWHKADHVRIAIALDSWQPTQGTRITGQRNTVPRVQLSDGALVTLQPSALPVKWDFPAPFGRQDVTSMPFSEVITIARDRRIGNASSVMNLLPLTEVRDPRTPGPIAADALGRSSQTFVVDVVAENDGRQRRAFAVGQDIYAITAPIVVEAAERILRGHAQASGSGAFALSELFEPHDFLDAIAARYSGFKTHFSFNEAEND
ncbi:saccharopine dehydrogenase family protein [Pedomonas mirosovicensis]|uniref:saccharopine dehydrogenase family protein n=1 Tax=Pedomonas mirosovicensis TaxID=2908641 RepID=UPI00216888D2|nr:saccharopine dehydrogenase NADP-binding domain-containing protein [Pedomonas mirosovicensis]MCH8686394.1 saccharopine dehydrogenase NADP-binding domain-containing protein [Pedomonas mirosovicensis]